ncbi:aminopeptidase [Roseivirga sp. E12]|uniref:aminopeptidase n=1 Tax=Roseivirga sp. E12 TaxID=2819237 RepID=UPI001ABC9B0C|nr:aminopeptidase [Roseivirga sp. E12]MBO3700330.1 aminopeptidase [Roseivirga sp. E12]
MKVKKILKRVGLVLLVLIATAVIWQFELVNYGLMQLRGQLRVINEAVSLEEYLQDTTITADQRAKVQVILEAKAFAFERLGINYSENYSTIFDQEGKPSMFVITACEPFAFRPRLWSFPVVGKFPYKGFFNREKAVEEARRIREEEGMEVGLRTAGGWSTLGWFKDPVLSNMLNRSEGDLASLIIHELTHGTLFVKDSVTFNENLATFIGDRGAVLFLEEKYGQDSKEVNDFIAKNADEETFKKYMLGAAQRLDSLYRSITDLELGEKQELKTALIDEIKLNFDTVDFKSQRYVGYFDNFTPNNTFFMSLLRYNSQQDVLALTLEQKFDGNLLAYLEHLKTQYPSL